jgi:hypothetical protein
MRVIVCGGRDFCDKEWLAEALDRWHARRGIDFLRQGGQVMRHPEDAHLPMAKRRRIGADYFAKRWAISRMIDHDEIRADWDRYGAAAGPIRNGMMLRPGDIDWVISFPGGDGTADMLRKARDAEIKVSEFIRPEKRPMIVVKYPGKDLPPQARAIPLAPTKPAVSQLALL